MTMVAEREPDSPVPTPLPEAGLAVEIRQEGERAWVCALAGDLDVETLQPAAQALRTLLERRPSKVVVDLRGVGFCDSSGLNLLLKSRREAAAAVVDFRLAAAPATVMRVLELTGAQAVFSLHSSVREALAAPLS
ncbi:STAS domain-containing protein [Kitasatospora sp. NPDC006697]|uniref:STAS domain-containing protein n=1 Tax=Kitasatospora sp. NPDC006697 TaxID=3364020 RepID=UPI00368E79F7